MDLKKNYAEVLIDGKVYTLGGSEDVSYFQKVAAYVNHKLGELRSHPGFLKQKEDYQLVMLEINMADDYFKAQEAADLLKQQKEETDRDIYGLKHELINTQMKLEEAQNRIQELEAALRESRVSVRAVKEAAVSSEPVKAREPEETQVKEQEEPEPVKTVLSEEERLAREEEEKQKALEAARAATEQLLRSRQQQGRGHQTRK